MRVNVTGTFDGPWMGFAVNTMVRPPSVLLADATLAVVEVVVDLTIVVVIPAEVEPCVVLGTLAVPWEAVEVDIFPDVVVDLCVDVVAVPTWAAGRAEPVPQPASVNVTAISKRNRRTEANYLALADT